MNDLLRDRILRKLNALSDERLYQVLDYVEFLESRYAERQAPPASVFSRFAEGVEDTLRAGRVSASTVAETMGFLNKAMGVLNGVAAAGKSVANAVVGAAQKVAGQSGAPGAPGTPGQPGPATATGPAGGPIPGTSPNSTGEPAK
jgi:hypothetical protein